MSWNLREISRENHHLHLHFIRTVALTSMPIYGPSQCCGAAVWIFHETCWLMQVGPTGPTGQTRLVGLDVWWCLFGLLMFIMSSCFHLFIVVGWMFVYMFAVCQAYRCLKATIAVCWCLASTWPTTIQGQTTIPPWRFPPTLTFLAQQVSGHRTNTYHLGGLQWNLELNQKFMESSSMVTGWSCCLDRLRRLWQRWWGGHWKRFFLLVGKLKENCVEKVCCFFSKHLVSSSWES